MDVELGNKEEESHSFYPPKNIIYDIVSYNYVTFEKFFESHVVDLSLKKVKIYAQLKVFTFEIMNVGIGSLRNYTANIKPVYK